MRLVFASATVASLGTHLSSGGALLEACKALEETLLTFPLSDIILHVNSFDGGRVGRTGFWSSAIEHAFPIVHERGLMSVIHSKCCSGGLRLSIYVTDD